MEQHRADREGGAPTLRSILEARQNLERQKPFSERAETLLGGVQGLLERGDIKKAKETLEKMQPTLIRMLKLYEENEKAAFGRMLEFLELRKELLKANFVIATELENNDELGKTILQEIERIDAEIASLTDLLIADPDKAN